MTSTEQTLARLNDLKAKYEAEEQKLLDLLPAKERKELGFPIKHIHQLDTFQANGKKYIIRDSLTIERFKQFEDLQTEVGYGVDFYEMFNNISKIYTYLNSSKPADAAIIAHNLMTGIKNKLDEREHPVLRLCTLFITLENEDITGYDSALSDAKIEDWKLEGISMDSFFQLAFSLVSGFTPALKAVSQSILEETTKARKEALS